LPTLGKPTMPHLNPMAKFQSEKQQRLQELRRATPDAIPDFR
jgi:hypothetical protein